MSEFDSENEFLEQQKRKTRTKFLKSLSEWKIDKQRSKNLGKISNLPIPQRSILILSKLVINHQITEIVRVLDKRRDCVTIHARINLNSQVYREEDSDSVLIKVFTRKLNTRVNFTSAKLFRGVAYSEERNRNHPKTNDRSFFVPFDKEILPILSIDNVVIVKMVGDQRPPPSLVEMVKRFPQRRKQFYRQIIELVVRLRDQSYQFWSSKASIRNILWHNNEWNILYNELDVDVFCMEDNERIFSRNLIAVMKVFLHFGLTRKEVKQFGKTC